MDGVCYGGIGFGCLCLKAYGNEMRFEEDFDPIPELVEIFRHLQNEECGDWRVWDESEVWIAFTAPTQRKEIVYLSSGAEGSTASFTKRFRRKDILQMLKDIFQALLMDRDFPYQYPCFGELDEAMCAQAQEKAAILANGNMDVEDELYKAACREGRIPLSPAGQEIYQRCKKLLDDCINSRQSNFCGDGGEMI